MTLDELFKIPVPVYVAVPDNVPALVMEEVLPVFCTASVTAELVTTTVDPIAISPAEFKFKSVQEEVGLEFDGQVALFAFKANKQLNVKANVRAIFFNCILASFH